MNGFSLLREKAWLRNITKIYIFLIMDTFRVIIYVLIFSSHFLCAKACSQKFAQEPLCGYHCVSRPDSVVTVQQTDRPQCVWKCLTSEACQYINHNHATRQCDLGLSKCESLIPAIGVLVNAFGPPRDTCVHWGSSQIPGRVPVEIPGQDRLARMKFWHSYVVGKFNFNSESFWANNGGTVFTGPAGDSQGIEFLTINPACTLPWMPYTAGGLLPAEVINGGHLLDGSTAFVVKVLHSGVQTFGYYSATTELAYYEYQHGAKTKTSMEMLVLL